MLKRRVGEWRLKIKADLNGKGLTNLQGYQSINQYI
jgi:hypothetical protein